MAFTTEAMAAVSAPIQGIEQNLLDLPSKEFTGYDPKGTTTVTGSPIERPSQDVKQRDTADRGAAESPGSEESVTLSPKISALARKEQAQRQREAAFKQREAALEAKLADAERYASLKSKLANKDYSAADELGMTYDEYTQYLLNKQAGDDPAEQRYRAVEEKLSNIEKQQEELAVKEYKFNQNLWKQEIQKTVADADVYPEIQYWKAESAVLQHINDSFELDGVELTTEQAAKEIEEQLVERSKRFADAPSLKNRAEQPRVLGAPKSSPQTITNNMTTLPPKPSSKPFHLMSESEQIAEAIRRVQAAKQSR